MRANSLLTLALWGCSPSPPPVEPAPRAALPEDTAWVAAVTLSPTLFTELIGRTSREGWIAAHAHRYPEAWTHFHTANAPLAAGRVSLQMALTQGDLARLQAEGWSRLAASWAGRGALPPMAQQIASLAEACGHEDLDAAALLALWTQQGATWPEVGALHQHALEGAPEALAEAAQAPLAVERLDSYARHYYDPCLHRTLALSWEARANTALGPDGHRALTGGDLTGSLFAPWMSGEDLAAGLTAGTPVRHLGALPTVAQTGEPHQVAREEVRALDDDLGRWRADLTRRASPDGVELLTQLALMERLRAERLTATGRAALDAGQPRRALSLLEAARDAAEPSISPLNSPSLLALTAHAQLQLGLTREALDTLQPLREGWPETLGLIEVLNDLVVMESMNRQGDSKENQ